VPFFTVLSPIFVDSLQLFHERKSFYKSEKIEKNVVLGRSTATKTPVNKSSVFNIQYICRGDMIVNCRGRLNQWETENEVVLGIKDQTQRISIKGRHNIVIFSVK